MNRIRAAALLLAVLTACPAPARPGPTATPSTPATTPAGGGTITVAYPTEPPTLNPFSRAGHAAATRDLVRLLMPGLLHPDGSRQLLASDPVVETGPPFRVTLQLRADAVWSDGTAISAADLRHTWKVARAAGHELYRSVGSLRRLGPYRARLTFARPEPRWRELFSGGLGVLPAHVDVGDLDRGWPVSGGPFVLDRWRAGLDMRFVRNERAPNVTPALEQLRVVFVPDAVGALRLLERGELDVLGPYHAPDWARRVQEAGGSAVPAPTASTAWLLWDRTRAPFRGPAVRRALAMSFDHERIVEGLVAAEGSTRPDIGREDLPAARATLGEAGWRGRPVRSRDGRELRVTLALDESEDLLAIVAGAIKFQAERLGIRLEVVPLRSQRLWREWFGGSDMQAAIVISRGPDAPLRGIALYDVTVTLAAAPGVQITATDGPDGVFASAHTWRAEVP